MRLILVIGALFLAAGTPTLFAGAKSSEDLRQTFATIRTAEFPREVGKLISKEKGQDREERSVGILRDAVIYNPAAAFATVGSACRVAPDLAARFAATAASIQPQIAPGLARAAAAAAPAHAAEIAAAVAKERPAQFALIAYEVSFAVPGQDEKIVNAVVAGLPNLKAFTGAAGKATLAVVPDSTAVGGSTPQPVTASHAITDLVATAPLVESTAHELGIKTDQLLVAELTPAQTSAVATKVQTAKAANVSAMAAKVGVPFVPGGGTPGEANRAQTVVVTPGSGRNYGNGGH